MEIGTLPAVSAPLPWHGEAWNRFTEQLESEQLPHALLLTGARYTGKARLALALARLLLCQAPSDGLNCGQCHACNLSASGSHGDFRLLQPEQKSRVIKIDQVRELVSFATKTASFGKRKVMVIAPADAMNTNAANALLKSLEEPSSETYLILVCQQLQGVPATIRSRCQMLKLPPPPQEPALTWLDHITGGRPESERLYAMAGGLPLLAEAIFCQEDGEELVSARVGVRALLAGRIAPAELVALLLQASLEDVLEQLNAALQDLLRNSAAPGLRSPGGLAAFALLDEVRNMERAVRAGANPNRQLMIESIVGKVHRELGASVGNDSIVA